MASRIVHLSGGFDDRQAAHDAITEGMFHLQSGDSYGCYTRRQWYPDWRECDVITVRGESRVVDRLPGEPTDEFRGDSYWVSDYTVVLEKPDTELFRIAADIPTYPAEAGMAHSVFAVGAVFTAFVVTTLVAWLFSVGSWSVVWGVGASAFVYLAFKYQYAVRVFIGGLFSAYYVRTAIRRGLGTREHYRELVAHLSKSDHPTLSAVSHQALSWI